MFNTWGCKSKQLTTMCWAWNWTPEEASLLHSWSALQVGYGAGWSSNWNNNYLQQAGFKGKETHTAQCLLLLKCEYLLIWMPACTKLTIWNCQLLRKCLQFSVILTKQRKKISALVLVTALLFSNSRLWRENSYPKDSIKLLKLSQQL